MYCYWIQIRAHHRYQFEALLTAPREGPEHAVPVSSAFLTAKSYSFRHSDEKFPETRFAVFICARKQYLANGLVYCAGSIFLSISKSVHLASVSAVISVVCFVCDRKLIASWYVCSASSFVYCDVFFRATCSTGAQLNGGCQMLLVKKREVTWRHPPKSLRCCMPSWMLENNYWWSCVQMSIAHCTSSASIADEPFFPCA